MPTSKAVTPTECPTIQLHSDTTLSWRQIPPVKGSVLQDCPHSKFQTPISSPGQSPVLLTNNYRLEFSTPPSSGLINLLEWLKELRETFYSLDHRFIRKGYNSRTARWKRCIGRPPSFLFFSSIEFRPMFLNSFKKKKELPLKKCLFRGVYI